MREDCDCVEFDFADVLFWLVREDVSDDEDKSTLVELAEQDPYVAQLVRQLWRLRSYAQAVEKWIDDQLGPAICDALGMSPHQIAERIGYVVNGKRICCGRPAVLGDGSSASVRSDDGGYTPL